MNIFPSIRPLDWTLTAAMVAIAAFVGVANVVAGPTEDVVHPLDSHSALMVPVFALAALPILWRRRAILPAVAVSVVVVAASVLAFGWVTRCGFALPLSIAMAYAVARFAGGRRNQVLGMVGILALQLVTLVQDASTGGLGALSFSVPVAALAYGVGRLVQSRGTKRVPTPTVVTEHVNA